MSLSTTTGELAGEITKAAPPVSVTGLTLMGVSLNEWVLMMTLLYTVLQIGWFVYSKFIRKVKDASE